MQSPHVEYMILHHLTSTHPSKTHHAHEGTTSPERAVFPGIAYWAIPEILQGCLRHMCAWFMGQIQAPQTHHPLPSLQPSLLKGSSPAWTVSCSPTNHPESYWNVLIFMAFLQPKLISLKINGSAYPIIFPVLSLKPILFCLVKVVFLT